MLGRGLWSVPGARAVATAGIATAQSVTQPMIGEDESYAELAIEVDSSECEEPASCLVDILVYLEALPPLNVALPFTSAACSRARRTSASGRNPRRAAGVLE